jgi:murein DD-endopeptidase MepM/ murein hydrolase activator NlpD
MRSVITFFTGFMAGMLFLLALLWSHGSLQPVRAAAPAAGVTTAVARRPAPPPPPPQATPEAALEQDVPSLIIPVEGADASKIVDTFASARSGDKRHEATDIMAPQGTPVLAAADGTIVKLFLSRAGGNTIYQFDPTRTWCYYYAHLDHYAAGLTQGATVKQGQVIGYVGSTGDASPSAPHLHFAINKLGPEKQWWKGTAVNPYPVLMRHARQ